MADILPIQKLETRHEATKARAKNLLAIQTFIQEVVLDGLRKYSAVIIVAGVTLVVGNVTGYVVGVGKFDPRVSGVEIAVANGQKYDAKQDEDIRAINLILKTVVDYMNSEIAKAPERETKDQLYQGFINDIYKDYLHKTP